MSTLKIHICNIFDVFQNVTDVFTGSYVNENVEIRKMRSDLHTESIPRVSQDRKNLKSDGSKVSGDYNKAFEEKKAQFCLNG